MYYIYLLKEKSGRIYIGSTANLGRRLREHRKDKPGFILSAYIAVANEGKCRELEKYFKSGSGRAFLKKRVLTDEALA